MWCRCNNSESSVVHYWIDELVPWSNKSHRFDSSATRIDFTSESEYVVRLYFTKFTCHCTVEK